MIVATVPDPRIRRAPASPHDKRGSGSATAGWQPAPPAVASRAAVAQDRAQRAASALVTSKISRRLRKPSPDALWWYVYPCAAPAYTPPAERRWPTRSLGPTLIACTTGCVAAVTILHSGEGGTDSFRKISNRQPHKCAERASGSADLLLFLLIVLPSAALTSSAFSVRGTKSAAFIQPLRIEQPARRSQGTASANPGQ